MDYLFNAFITALKLIVSFDYEVINCTLVSLKVSCIAVLFATIIGIPLGFAISLNQFRGKSFLLTVLNTMMALPTVVVGLFVFACISRQGPLGVVGLLFTPTAMVIGQFILATPIITALSISAIQGVDPRIKISALALGARSYQVVLPIIIEARFAIMAAAGAEISVSPKVNLFLLGKLDGVFRYGIMLPLSANIGMSFKL